MKNFSIPFVAGAFVALVALAQAPAVTTTTLEWDPPTAPVLRHVVQYRPAGSSVPWTEVSVDPPANRVEIPVTPAGTEFRAAAVNAFGPSVWAGPYSVPQAPKVRLVYDLTR